jgi:hypothetical protein
MSDLKFAILEKLYKANEYRVIKNSVIEERPKKHMTNRRRAIDNFISEGAIKEVGDFVELTEKGIEMYEDAHDQRKRDKHNFLIALISVIAASIAALAPVIELIISMFS